jgi:hypothetical protein
MAFFESCNSRKGDCLLHEVHVSLKQKPKAPVHPTIAFSEQFWKEQHDEPVTKAKGGHSNKFQKT